MFEKSKFGKTYTSQKTDLLYDKFTVTTNKAFTVTLPIILW